MIAAPVTAMTMSTLMPTRRENHSSWKAKRARGSPPTAIAAANRATWSRPRVEEAVYRPAQATPSPATVSAAAMAANRVSRRDRTKRAKPASGWRAPSGDARSPSRCGTIRRCPVWATTRAIWSVGGSRAAMVMTSVPVWWSTRHACTPSIWRTADSMRAAQSGQFNPST